MRRLPDREAGAKRGSHNARLDALFLFGCAIEAYDYSERGDYGNGYKKRLEVRRDLLGGLHLSKPVHYGVHGCLPLIRLS